MRSCNTHSFDSRTIPDEGCVAAADGRHTAVSDVITAVVAAVVTVLTVVGVLRAADTARLSREEASGRAATVDGEASARAGLIGRVFRTFASASASSGGAPRGRSRS